MLKCKVDLCCQLLLLYTLLFKRSCSVELDLLLAINACLLTFFLLDLSQLSVMPCLFCGEQYDAHADVFRYVLEESQNESERAVTAVSAPSEAKCTRTNAKVVCCSTYAQPYTNTHTYKSTCTHAYMHTQLYTETQFVSLFVVNVFVLYLGVCYVYAALRCVSYVYKHIYINTYTCSYQPGCPLHPFHCCMCLCL